MRYLYLIHIYAGSGAKTLTAKINYAHKDEETDPSDNMRTTTVSIASPIDSTYDFSVSNISVTPSAAYQGAVSYTHLNSSKNPEAIRLTENPL